MEIKKKFVQAGSYPIKWLSEVNPYQIKVKKAYVLSPLSGDFALPKNKSIISNELMGQFTEKYSIKPLAINRINKCYVTSYGVIYKNFKLFNPSLPAVLAKDEKVVWMKEEVGYTTMLMQFRYQLRKTDFHHEMIIFHDYWSTNYYHWLVDSLPRLLILTEEEKAKKLAMPAKSNPAMLKTVRALGFNNLFIFGQDKQIYVEHIIAPERTAYGSFQHPKLVPILRENLLSAFCPDPVEPTRLIFVSRNRGPKRRLVNESDLVPLLSACGFETVYFEELDFEAQIRLMCETKVLIGVHGANLTNILFMHPSCTVIELMNEDYLALVYYRMSSILNLNYYFVPCRPEKLIRPIKEPYDREANDSDVIVDVPQVANILSTIGIKD